MKSTYTVLTYLLLVTLLCACHNEPYQKVTINGMKGQEYKDWIVDKSYNIDETKGLGISALKQFIFLTDTSNNIVISYDTLLNKLDTIAIGMKVCYMNQQQSKVIMPVYDRDSIFVYRGSPDYYKFSLPITLDKPTSFDGLSIRDFALVDQGNNRLVINNMNEYIVVGSQGSADGQFNFPTSVCLHSEKYFVLDSGNKRIQIFDKKGNFISSFGQDDNLMMPAGITSDRINLYVSDPEKNQILVYNGNGELQDSIKTIVNRPSDLYAYEDQLYVCNQEGHTITILRKK